VNEDRFTAEHTNHRIFWLIVMCMVGVHGRPCMVGRVFLSGRAW
jgi:hypothetical protein